LPLKLAGKCLSKDFFYSTAVILLSIYFEAWGGRALSGFGRSRLIVKDFPQIRGSGIR
jgi:hypothetical protein